MTQQDRPQPGGIVFAHGMEGSPAGTKATYLREQLGAVTPWLGEMGLDEQVEELARAVTAIGPTVVVGSSLGGLAALGLCASRPELVSHLVLLAPAVGMHRFEGIHHEVEDRRPGLLARSRHFSGLSVPSQVPATVIHGMEDEVILTPDVISLVERSPSASLILVHDDHSLGKSRDLILSVAAMSYGFPSRSTSY